MFKESSFLSRGFCSAFQSITVWVGLSSAFALTLISIERYLLFKNSRHIKYTRYIRFILIAHLITVSFSSLNFVLNLVDIRPIKLLECYVQSSNQSSEEVIVLSQSVREYSVLFYRLVFIFMGFACILITSYCYYVIYQIIRLKQMKRLLKLNGLITLKPATFKKVNQTRMGNASGTSQSTRDQFSSKYLRTQFTRTRNISKSHLSIEYMDRRIGGEKVQIPRVMSISEPHLNVIQNKTSSHESSKLSVNTTQGKKMSLVNLDSIRVELSSSSQVNQARKRSSEDEENRVAVIAVKDVDTSSRSFSRTVMCISTGVEDKSISFIKKTGTSKRESDAIKRTLIPVIVFYCFILPFCLTFTITASFQHMNLKSDYLFKLSTALVLCHSSINPIVYSVTNTEIKKAIRRLLRNKELLA